MIYFNVPLVRLELTSIRSKVVGSTNWATTAFLLSPICQRTRKLNFLHKVSKNNTFCKKILLLDLLDGLEPSTCWLQISGSTNWATAALKSGNEQTWTANHQIFSLALYQLSYEPELNKKRPQFLTLWPFEAKWILFLISSCFIEHSMASTFRKTFKGCKCGCHFNVHDFYVSVVKMVQR